MPGGPPGQGGPHPPADCNCPLCVVFRKVASLVFGANTSQALRDRSRPFFEGLCTQLLEIALEVQGTSASRAGEADPAREARPGGPPLPSSAPEPAGGNRGGGDPGQTAAAPGGSGVKEEQEESPARKAEEKVAETAALPVSTASEGPDGEGATSAGSRPEVETEENEELQPKGKRLPPLPRQRRGGYDREDSSRRRRRRERSRRRRRDPSPPSSHQELHPKAAPSSKRPRTPSRSPPSVHTPEDQSSSAGECRNPNDRFRGTSLEVAEEEADDTAAHTPPAGEETEQEEVELPEEEPQLEEQEPSPHRAKGKGQKGKGKGKGSKGKKGKKSKPKKRNRGLKKVQRNIDFYDNKRRDPTWRRSAQ